MTGAEFIKIVHQETIQEVWMNIAGLQIQTNETEGVESDY